MQIIINAGGTGTRLWPISTNQKPKQFVPLIDEENFLKKTYNRLVTIFQPEQIWVNTNEKFKLFVEESLPANFPKKNILTEPEKRDNFAAITSHAAVVGHYVGVDEPLVFVHADHLVLEKDWQQFNQALIQIGNSIELDKFEIVTAGVKPTFANTQLGYIEIEASHKSELFAQVVPVKSFKEKPEIEDAEKFLQSGNYLWNLGYFSFKFSHLLKNIQALYPELVPILEGFRVEGKIQAEDYQKFPKISIDYALIEKISNLGVIGIDIGWEDIGNWAVAKKYLPSLEANNMHLELQGQNNQVRSVSGKKVAFIGVSDLLLVESEDSILIINTKHAGEVKKAAEYFESL